MTSIVARVKFAAPVVTIIYSLILGAVFARTGVLGALSFLWPTILNIPVVVAASRMRARTTETVILVAIAVVFGCLGYGLGNRNYGGLEPLWAAAAVVVINLIPIAFLVIASRLLANNRVRTRLKDGPEAESPALQEDDKGRR